MPFNAEKKHFVVVQSFIIFLKNLTNVVTNFTKMMLASSECYVCFFCSSEQSQLQLQILLFFSFYLFNFSALYIQVSSCVTTFNNVLQFDKIFTIISFFPSKKHFKVYFHTLSAVSMYKRLYMKVICISRLCTRDFLELNQ